MSAAQDTSTCQILREGYLDVKAPPDSPERILHKAWRRLWVCAAVYLPSGRGEPHLILQFSRKADDEAEKRLKASRDGLRLFRCKSGSRGLRTWGLSSGSSLLIYLADETEEDTQQWMQTLREGLWPSISSPQTMAGGCHEVSLIDDEKSFASGLLGVYGRLVKNSEDAICVIHPHWQGTQMRWRVEDIVDVQLVRKTVKEEDSEAGVFNLSVKSTKKDSRILQFYCKTASTTVDWIQSILDPKHKKQISDTGKATLTSQSHNTGTDPNLITRKSIDQTAESAVGNQSKTTQPIQKEDSEQYASNSVYGKVQSKGYLHLSNIPGHFLDASMSSPNLKRSGDSKDKPASAGDSGDDSPGEFYDHIYEEMNPQKDRSETVYEEVDDTENDYVPPMPPTLPARLSAVVAIKPDPMPTPDAATLRLQKLSVSLSEALKLVEETPQQKDTTETRPKLLRRVSSKKSRSLHHSPTLQAKAIPSVSIEQPSVMQRAVSVPFIPVEDTVLPLRPFHPFNDGKVSPKRNRDAVGKAHAPLTDILKSLQVENNPAQDEVRTQVDLLSSEIPIAAQKPKDLLSVESAETEAEYINMR